VPRRGPAGGALGLVRRTGYRIAAAAQRDLRRLAEVVMETHRAEARAARARSAAPLPADAFDLSDLSGGASADRAGALALASCYARG
jgi:D-alanyl-D-alanine carboxypeptidase